MGEEKLLTVRDVSIILGISEKEVLDLAEEGAIPAYKIGGVYVRFKREQVMEHKRRSLALKPSTGIPVKDSFGEKASDFLYFNDFYILAVIIIVFLLFIIFRGY